MKFSDGTPITAKNYIASLLANSTNVAVAAGGNGNAGQVVEGFDEFKAYEGEGDPVYFKGVQLIDDYTFAITYQADYANYYYLITFAGFSPAPMQMYLGENEIIVNENKECGLSEGFYKKEAKDRAAMEAMDLFSGCAEDEEDAKESKAAKPVKVRQCHIVRLRPIK